MPSPSTSGNPQYDVVVWGASGFTGKLVVEYLATNYPIGGALRWAVAGRDKGKIDATLATSITSGEKPDTIIADSHDRRSLDRMVGATKVVLTTVGPYANYGSDLVAACVANGTHYCDLAGEVQWMRQMIDQHENAARNSGARIVHSCGFDSIPSDIGVYFLQQQAIARHGKPCGEVLLLVKAIRGSASGGTFASMLNAMDEARSDRRIARILVDPYSLNPDGERSGPDGRGQTGIKFNKIAGEWTAPFVMSGVNSKIVRRTNALTNYAYGRNFRYSEVSATGKGLRGWRKAATTSAALAAFMAASSISVTRRLVVDKMIPQSGAGPSKKQREAGFFNLLLIGRLPDGNTVRVRVKGDRDPGYGSTSKMLSESAICLANDELTVGGGFWTPAASMGEQLIQRLTTRAGLSFAVE